MVLDTKVSCRKAAVNQHGHFAVALSRDGDKRVHIVTRHKFTQCCGAYFGADDVQNLECCMHREGVVVYQCMMLVRLLYRQILLYSRLEFLELGVTPLPQLILLDLATSCHRNSIYRARMTDPEYVGGCLVV